MEWQLIVALVIAIPIILFPLAFIWYLNLGGIMTAIKEAMAKRARRTAEKEPVPETMNEQAGNQHLR